MAFNPQTINKELDMANLAKHNANYSAIKTELDTQESTTSTHVAAQTAHGSTPEATAGKIMQRDSEGRAKVAAPSASDDIARKAEVDAVQTNLDAHEADSIAHLTSAEHTKLTGIAEGAEVNQNAFAQVNDVAAATDTDTLTIEGGTGITISTNPTTKKVIVTATGEATPGAHGPSHNIDGADPIPDLVTLRGDFDALTPADIGAETPEGAQAKVESGLAETLTHIFNIEKGFNADPTGSSSSSAAIQAALDAANNAGGGEVFIPQGKYRITEKLITYPNVRMSGVGDKSELFADSSMTGYMVENLVDIDNAIFENFCLNGGASSNPQDIMGFKIDGGVNVTFRSVNVYDTRGYNPFQIFGVTHSRIVDCLVDGNSGGDGIAFGSGCSYSIIQGCTSRNVSDTSFVIADRSHFSAIIGCTAERGTGGQGNGIAVTSSRGVLVANNVIDGFPNVGRGIVTYADPNSGEPMERLLVTGNTVIGSHPDASGALVAINGLTTFTGNLIKNSVIGIRINGPDCFANGNHIIASSNMDTAIMLEGSTGAVVLGNTVDSDGTGSWSYGLRCLPNTKDSYMAFNVVRGATFADYQDLDGSNKQLMNRFGSVTKSGQIDSFDNIIQETTAYFRLGGTAPAAPTKGDMYFDGSSNTLKVFDGAAWKTVNWT